MKIEPFELKLFPEQYIMIKWRIDRILWQFLPKFVKNNDFSEAR